ncbi:hypothetical protein [Streptomyces fuscichromogenes]|uniref:Uncharacterized protein n=1 Tax=Streptomyces fuscichromogenes TaxID=1324013 RepID=A0A917XL73_9ACTN|nr:hypothetical protein [Streptomyces fuscichromogenes]GGN34200.1 hypothetical protein GCM10011578_074790 [Streptomyces fuscichromogenes]
MDGATGEDAAIATSMNNASMQIGSAIGLAALVSLGTDHAAALQHAGADPMTAAAHGDAFSFAIAAGVTAFGAFLGFVGIRPAPAETPTMPADTRQRVV